MAHSIRYIGFEHLCTVLRRPKLLRTKMVLTSTLWNIYLRMGIVQRLESSKFNLEFDSFKIMTFWLTISDSYCLATHNVAKYINTFILGIPCWTINMFKQYIILRMSSKL